MGTSPTSQSTTVTIKWVSDSQVLLDQTEKCVPPVTSNQTIMSSVNLVFIVASILLYSGERTVTVQRFQSHICLVNV